jgi:SAM-dependent methyltransferase
MTINEIHTRLIEVHGAHGEELGFTKTFRRTREVQAEFLKNVTFDSLLIIGPGHGDEAAELFSKMNKEPSSIRIIACDLNVDRLERFTHRFPHAQIFIGDVLSKEFEDFSTTFGKVDVVQMSFVLHDQTEHNKPRLLSTLLRVLRPGGCLICADPTLPEFPNYLPHIPDQVALKKVKHGLTCYYDTYIQEVEEWTHIAQERKIELIESLYKGLQDALKHEDGREAFDIPVVYKDRFALAGFTNILIKDAFNTVKVICAYK